uniref:Uncharacterized protein n=1 Tax=Rousettus aegyptiacus TaxID=9407 RepID=A0A7J8GBE1_ROUAE|nr:hypothetical protein HJG63_011776 [Rousettus aegyptiacus]
MEDAACQVPTSRTRKCRGQAGGGGRGRRPQQTPHPAFTPSTPHSRPPRGAMSTSAGHGRAAGLGSTGPGPGTEPGACGAFGRDDLIPILKTRGGVAEPGLQPRPSLACGLKPTQQPGDAQGTPRSDPPGPGALGRTPVHRRAGHSHATNGSCTPLI